MRGRVLGRAVALVLAGLALAASPGRAAAQEIRVEWRGGTTPYVSFDARRLVDEGARARVDSGLTQHLEVAVEARRGIAGDVIASRAFLCDVTWDHWQQAYLVRRYVAGGASRTTRFAVELAEGTAEPSEPSRRSARRRALGHCLDVRALRVGRAASWREVGDEAVVFEVTASLNPVTRGRCRDLLRSSSRHGTPIGGVVISVLPRQICRATRALVFRSTPERPP